jgi:hypothetical protein
MPEMRNAFFFLLENLREEPLGRPNHRWEDNIRTDLREIGWEVVDWMYLAQGTDQCRAVVNTVMNHRIP